MERNAAPAGHTSNLTIGHDASRMLVMQTNRGQLHQCRAAHAKSPIRPDWEMCRAYRGQPSDGLGFTGLDFPVWSTFLLGGLLRSDDAGDRSMGRKQVCRSA
jgi:hypothetical protein